MSRSRSYEYNVLCLFVWGVCLGIGIGFLLSVLSAM